MLGVVFSTYSGVSSTMLNPAMMTGSKVYLDINLVSGSTFAKNDMFYAPPEANTIKGILTNDIDLSKGPFNFDRGYNYYGSPSDKHIAAIGRLMLPSVMLQNGKHAYAFTSGVRSYQTGNNIPYELPVMFFEGLGYEAYLGKEFDFNHFSITGMSWVELGLSYAYDFYYRGKDAMSFGVTVKGLLGLEGTYFKVDNLNMVIVDENTINFKNFDADFGYSLPLDYDNDELNLQPFVKGFGVGIDLGFLYTRRNSSMAYDGEDKLCAKPYNDYIYKFGLSILDLGSIGFKQNTELQSFDNVGVYWENFDTTQYAGVSGTLQNYSSAFYGDPAAAYRGDQIRIGTPATISVQFDYNFQNNLYIAAMWSHPLRFNLETVWRPSQLAVVPRYENRYFGVSIPIGIFDYQYPQVGFAVRLYSVTIGTEWLGPYLGNRDFTGLDIYFSMKINLNKGSCMSYFKGACFNRDFGRR